MEFDPMTDYEALSSLSEDEPDYGLELMKWASKVAAEARAEDDDKNYVVNQKQMMVFLKVQLYFIKLIEPQYGEWVHAEIRSPKEKHGHITVKAGMIDFTAEADKIKEFCDMMSESISLGIYPTNDGEFMYLSLVIPDVFVKKTE